MRLPRGQVVRGAECPLERPEPFAPAREDIARIRKIVSDLELVRGLHLVEAFELAVDALRPVEELAPTRRRGRHRREPSQPRPSPSPSKR